MREIKFRAWDKVNKRMYFIGGINFLKREFIGFPTENFAGKDFKYLNFDDVETLEFTGMRDLKKKDAYEGDIIKPISKESAERALVRFEHIGMPNGIGGVHCPAFFSGNLDITHSIVIGNKYENPELLAVE